MANKSRSKRAPQRSANTGNISRPERPSIRRVQGGRADTGRDRGEGAGRDHSRRSPAPGRGGDGRMGRRDGGWLEDDRRPEERGDYHRRGDEGSGGGAHWEPARRGGGSWQSGAGRWESSGYRDGPDRGERWAGEDRAPRPDPRERRDRGAESRHDPRDYHPGDRPRAQEGRDSRADWRPSLPSREFPRPGRAGREDAPYGEENREFRPQDWDPHGWRERDYGRTGRDRYAGDFRRAEGYDDDRYGPGWHGQSEFRPERDEEDRHADLPGSREYGASERLGRFGDRGASGHPDDRERFGRPDDDREYFGRSSPERRDQPGSYRSDREPQARSRRGGERRR